MGADRKAEMGPGAPAVRGGVEGPLRKDPLTQALITSLAALQGRRAEEGQAAKTPPTGDQPRPRGGEATVVAKRPPPHVLPHSGPGRRVSEAGFPPAAAGPPAPYPVHAHHRLATFQPVTLKAVPEGPTAPRLVRAHAFSSSGLLAAHISREPHTCGRRQGRHRHAHCTGGKTEAQGRPQAAGLVKPSGRSEFPHVSILSSALMSDLLPGLWNLRAAPLQGHLPCQCRSLPLLRLPSRWLRKPRVPSPSCLWPPFSPSAGF